MSGHFYTRSFTVEAVQQLELSWQTTSNSSSFNEFWGHLCFIKKISYTGKAYKIIRDISCMSYGMYLMHMLILPYIFVCVISAMSLITILVTALVTYVIYYIITKMISCLKYGKYIVG